MRIIWVDSCPSTNSYVASMPDVDGGVVVAARTQTAGRGQRGNSWEAEPGCNLTFSVAWKPEGVLPREQFSISEAVALAVVDLLAEMGVEAKVKWPNDIYVGDRKICGILIEHSVMGLEIDRTIAGVGININQQEFVSDAPNPVSLVMLTGKQYPLQPLLERYAEILQHRLGEIANREGRETTHKEFKGKMWRNDGNFHPFRDKASGSIYSGRIVDVEDFGYLHVEDEVSGERFKYAFKEVEFLL